METKPLDFSANMKKRSHEQAFKPQELIGRFSSKSE